MTRQFRQHEAEEAGSIKRTMSTASTTTSDTKSGYGSVENTVENGDYRTHEKPTEAKPESASWHHSVFVWICVVLAIFAQATIGPMFKWMEVNGVTPCLAASWRCQCMMIFLLPLALAESWYDRRNRVDWFSHKPGMRFPLIIHVIFAGLAWAGNLLFWTIGLQYTTTFKASLAATCYPVLLVVYFALTGVKVTRWEIVGVFVAFGGMILSSLEQVLYDETGEAAANYKWEAFGLFLCFMAAGAELVVLFDRLETKKYVPLIQYTASTTVVVVICAAFTSSVLEGSQVFCLSDTCQFGWMSKRWIVTMMIFSLVVAVLCNLGFNYSMQYMSPLVFSCLGLLDPAVTAVLSWSIGVEPWPRIITWAGGAVVIGGVGSITYGEHVREKQSENEKADVATDRPSSTNSENGDVEMSSPPDESTSLAAAMRRSGVLQSIVGSTQHPSAHTYNPLNSTDIDNLESEAGFRAQCARNSSMVV